MERKLTEQEVKMLKELYKDKELLGKGLIRQFILMNTYEPHYKVGDYVKITDLSTTLYGNRARDIKCKITQIDFWFRDKGKEMITYEAVALDQDGHEFFMCAEESLNGTPQSRHITGRCDDNINVIEKKSKYSQATDM